MECFVLGSCGMMPMPHRRLTSVAIRHEGRVFLLDCGEGSQVPYKEKHLGLRNLDLIATTHLHADHVLGLPGMLMLRAQMPDPGPLLLLGTRGLGRFVQHCRQDLGMHINYKIEVREWSHDADPVAYESDLVRLTWTPLRHGVPCVGYRLEEKQRAGRFDPEAATRLGVPQGPLWGQLQAGHSVEVESNTVQPDQVLGPPRRGRCVAYATDTGLTSTLEPLLGGADLAFVESMFAPEEEQDAAEKMHLTVIQAATAAKNAGAARLVLVHISPRYEDRELRRLAKIAREHHPEAEVARDGNMYEIALPD